MAVEIARRSAGGARVTVGHLLLALCAEPEGGAGIALRALLGDVPHPAAGLHAPGLPGWEDAVARGVPRPLWTHELLAGVAGLAAADLDDLLDALGSSRRALAEVAGEAEQVAGGWRAAPLPLPDDPDGAVPFETFGRYALLDRLTDAADLAVARARALGGTTHDLALALRTATGAPVDLTEAELSRVTARRPRPVEAVLEALPRDPWRRADPYAVAGALLAVC